MKTPEHHPSSSDISITRFENEAIETPFIPTIKEAYKKARHILPELPEVMQVSFENRNNYGEVGVDGFAKSRDMLGIGIDDREDKTAQFQKLPALILHESFHALQNATYDTGAISALDSAIYEGCATIFERDYADSEPKWGNYQKEDPKTLRRWLAEIKNITAEQYFEESGETWQKWAFYDPETDESWRVYKVGTWLVDTMLQERNLDITDLRLMSAEEIKALLVV